MTSNLGCVGLDVDDNAALSRLLARVMPSAVPVGAVGDVAISVWEDASGARLVLGERDGSLVDMLPSFAGSPGALLRGCAPLNDETAAAEVVDEAGEVCTGLAVDLEQLRNLGHAAEPVDAPAAVTALGVDVSLHADAEAFAASPASLLSPESDTEQPRPESVVEKGVVWPLRLGPESFFSYGVFGDPSEAQPYARLSGTVVDAERRLVELTGQTFVRVRVRTVGFEADVCLAADDHPVPPEPGQILSGVVYLVARLDGFPYGDVATPRKRWWKR